VFLAGRYGRLGTGTEDGAEWQLDVSRTQEVKAERTSMGDADTLSTELESLRNEISTLRREILDAKVERAQSIWNGCEIGWPSIRRL